jgi:arsenate reductase (thioredoxin)
MHQSQLMRQFALSPRPGLDPRADRVADQLRALADPLRLRLLGLLAHGDCPVTALAAAVDVGQSLVSFHLRELHAAGLVDLRRAGRFTYARLAAGRARGLLDQTADLLGLHAGQADAAPVPAGARAAVGDRFDRLLGADRVRQVLAEEAARLDHLPPGPAHSALVAAHATQRLRATVQAERRAPKPVPELLFVCVHNAGRSQMAAALTNHLAPGRVHAWSAGSRPAHALHPEAVAVMAEIGVDLTGQAPKPWSTDLVRAADVVVTMGCGEDIPRFPGVRYAAWQIPDPAGLRPTELRALRDQLTTHVRALLRELLDDTSTTSPPARTGQP